MALSALLSLAALVAAAGDLRAADVPDPLDLPTVLQLVEAGVGEAIILKQVAAAGPAFTVGVPEVLALKEAGASDGLIDGLMDLAGILPRREKEAEEAPAAVPDPQDVSESFRITRETDEQGRQVIHITNLDSSGRRMGGPPPDDGVPALRNAYVSRSGDERDDRVDDPQWREAGPAGPVPPVVVNVFQPDAEPVAILEEDDRVGDPYGRRVVSGYLPGFYGGHRACRHGYVFGLPSPPGSWTHFKRYHSGASFGHTGLAVGGLATHGTRVHGIVRPLSGHGLPVPFHTAGAAQLNAMRAGVRLGRR